MNVFQAARTDIAGKLEAAGITAVTLNPRGQPPCVLVDLPRVVASQGVGGWDIEVPVMVLAPPPGDDDAARWLLDQLEPIMVLYPGAVPADPRTVTRGDADLPAYVLTVRTFVPNPNC